MARVGLLALLTLTAYGLRSPAPPHPRHNKRAAAHVCGASRAGVDVGGAVAALAAAAALTLGGPAVAENELAALGAKGFDSSLVDTSCFAEAARAGGQGYGNAPMNDLLECSIEKNSCIKVAILPTGPDSATEAPAPPLVPVANFDQKTLEGTWYKVMGWNDRYDCFDCQKNSFASAGRDKLAVDVEFSMPRPPAGAYPLRLSEKLVFDQRSAPRSSAATRTRRLRSRAERSRGQKSVYRIAKEAGMVPANFCAVRNDLATCGADAAADEAPRPRRRKGLFTRAAFASEVDETGLASDRKPDPVLPKWVRTVGEEVASYLEDPHATERWVFAQQQKMGPGDD
ncbi:VDE lipocalin domain-containing protein [Aureococcus anophagefferens]|nr:VDE lipocalin domain-containing protein [Aureococcus anophagefferens]